ncbi:MAG: hypothetical protein ACTSRZ_18180 [Promethearchaeota archaeon]
MKLRKRVFQLFQTEYPELIDKIESEIYAFLEEMILQKDISLKEEINYKSPEFRDILHVMVEQIGKGLELIGVPKSNVEKDFKSEYKYFRTLTNLKTYKDWLYKEFSESINLLLFDEILDYFVDKNENIINKMLDLGLIENDIKDRLDIIEKQNPNLGKFLSIPVKIENKLKEILIDNTQFEQLVKNAEQEEEARNIIYFSYLLAEYFGFNNKLKFSSLVPFILERYEDWGKINENCTPDNPPELYKILYIANKMDLEANQDYCKRILREQILKLITQYSAPIFSAPYYVYSLVSIMKLLNLKLTAKFLDALIKKDNLSISIENLEKFKTEELCYIPEIYKSINLRTELTQEIISNINQVYQNRLKDGLYSTDDSKLNVNVLSIYSGILYHLDTNQAANLNLSKCLSFLINEISKILSILTPLNIEDYKISKKLIYLYFVIKSLDYLENAYEPSVTDGFSKFLFSKTINEESEDAQRKLVEEYIAESTQKEIEVFENLSKDKAGKNLEGIIKPHTATIEDIFEEESTVQQQTTTEISNTEISKEIEKADIVKGESDSTFSTTSTQPSPDVKKQLEKPLEKVKKTIKETTKEKIGTADEYEEPLPNTPNDIIQYLINPPSLPDKIIELIKINYRALRNPPSFIYNSPKNLYMYVCIEKILRIPHRLNAEQMDKALKKFWRKNAFGITKYPDIESTYYALFIYNEYNMMDKIDIYEIHDFILQELNYFANYKIYENKFIFLCLKILDKYGLKMMSYDMILNQFINNDYIWTDNFDSLLDTFDLIIAIKLLNPQADISEIRKRFLDKALVEIDTVNLINDNISDSANILITLGLFDGYNEYPNHSNRLYENIIKSIALFDDNLESENVGWGTNEIGFETELNVAFWSLFAIAIFQPYKTSKINSHICPQCGSYYLKIPKFCNQCGHKFS